MSTRPAVQKPTFSGHESFPLRYAWLKKGYDALSADPCIFSSESAMTDLGVGKNMVRSIRYWGIKTGLWEPTAESRGREVCATALGQRLLSEGGWDPYMDDLGTIWLLHWLLASNPESSPTFWLLFSRQKPGPFTKEELLDELGEIAEEADGTRKISAKTLERDIGVTVRCYTRSRHEKGRDDGTEDAINSPLMALGLVRSADGKRGAYVAPLSAHPSLPALIFEASLVEWCARRALGSDRAIPFEDLLYGWGSPGRVFRLHEAALMDLVTQAVGRLEPTLRFDETAGVRQILLADPLPSWLDSLSMYYSASEEVR